MHETADGHTKRLTVTLVNTTKTPQLPADLTPILERINAPWMPRIDCGEGWYALLLELDQALSQVEPAYVILQVKEKFGALRFYFELPEPHLISESSDAQQAEVERRAEQQRVMTTLVIEAEERSMRTCERCGAPARTASRVEGWLKTSCRDCQA